MGFFHTLLAIAILCGIALGDGIGTEPTSLRFAHSVGYGANINRQRFLRVHEWGDIGGVANNAYEERVSAIVSKLSDLLEKFSDKEYLVVRWANADKTEDFVKGKLKLKGLTGHALKEHTNCKFFEKFLRVKNWNQHNAWLKTETSTTDAWKKLGLENIYTWNDFMHAVDRDAFKLYQRYAEFVDDNAIINVGKKIKPVPVVSSDASWVKKVARMLNWKRNNLPEAYVMMALGFDTLPAVSLRSNQHDEIFMVFWLLKNKSSRDIGIQNTEGLLQKLLKIEKLSPEEMAKSDKFQTYKHLSDLIKKEHVDDQVPTLLEWLTPKLRW